MKVEYAKFEDFKRAAKELKIKRVFWRVEGGYVSEGIVAAILRLTGIPAEGTGHITLVERFFESPFKSEEDNTRYKEAIDVRKDKLQETFRDQAPDIILTEGIVFP